MDVVRGSQLDYYHVMAKSKKELIETATKGYVLEAADTILQGVQKMLNDLEDRLDKKFETIDTRFDKVELELRSLKDEVKGIKSDLSVTVSLEKFNKLKTKVDRLVSSN